jgi:sugar/nucleoside kinase (ribokinase family)
MTLEYTTHNVDQRNLYVKGLGGTITPEQLENLTAKAIVVSPSIRGEVMPAFFEILRKRENVLLSADVQGFIRVLDGESLVYAPWQEMESLVSNLDILKTDAVEAEYLTGEINFEKAAHAFHKMGAKEIILTHSEGLLIHADGQYYHYAFHSKSMAGRSGRGDTSVGSYVAKRLSLSPKDAGKWSAAATGLKVEIPGVFNRSITEVEQVIAKYYND